jgi:hypothetical protein
MRGAYKMLTIRGISLYIHWTFLLLIGWVLIVNEATGNNGHFSFEYFFHGKSFY